MSLLRCLGYWITLYIDNISLRAAKMGMLLGFFCTLENTTFFGVVQSFSLFTLCVDVFTLKLYYLHSWFLSFRTWFLFPWCSAFILNQFLDKPQTEELNYKFRTIPNLAAATQEAPHWVQRPAFYHRSQYNSSPFSLQKEIVFKIQFQGY